VREGRKSKERWVRGSTRFYQIAGITVQVESDLPITDGTFDRRFAGFRVAEPGADVVRIRHHFGPPGTTRRIDASQPLEQVYRKPPWAIYRGEQSWVYEGIASEADPSAPHCVAVFNAEHSSGDIFNSQVHETAWVRGGLTSLTMFPSDQILLARLLADRRGCLLHSGGLTIDGHGFVFMGHSDAGKSTVMELVRSRSSGQVEILCDDRNIVRLWPAGFEVHGTWSHGDVPDVSAASAPLRALVFLEQHKENEIIPLADRKQIWRRLLATLIRPLTTADWWHKEMDVLEQIMAQVPCFIMRFDRSGAIVAELERLVR
jgi:hypothetical protein